MALFAIWRDDEDGGEDVFAALAGEAHVVPPLAIARTIIGPYGTWHLAAFATETAFYRPEQQIWFGADGGACIIHGLIWREERGNVRLLDAPAVAALLNRPGAVLSTDIGGEFAVVRLHEDGTLCAFGDPAGLHQIFYATEGVPAIANRASFIAIIAQDWRGDLGGLIWLPTIGYRVGTRTAYHVARQLPQAHRIVARIEVTIDAAGEPILHFDAPRGLAHGEALLDQGIVQAIAAVRLATDRNDSIELPVTGGKDSRAVLALCLAAGLRDRLAIVTRGPPGHPDVLAGKGIAAHLGLPHRRLPPQGSDLPSQWPLQQFVEKLAAQSYQTDSMMGGWDYLVGRELHTETLITGHMGELLKAYAKRPLPKGRLDPVAMIRLQAPFDPLDLLRPAWRALLIDQVAADMDADRALGAAEEDLPDAFYLRNRIPNWLGGIRGIKSFERQPVMPLGVPALTRLAFCMTAEERKLELAHYRIIARCAPELLALPFAMQSWQPDLAAHADGVPSTPPILPAANAPPVFGNWQYSINSDPAIRAWLIDRIERLEAPLWEAIDRPRLIRVLAEQSMDYFGGISILGVVCALFGAMGIVLPVKLGERKGQLPIGLRLRDSSRAYRWSPEALEEAPVSKRDRPIAPVALRLLRGEALPT